MIYCEEEKTGVNLAGFWIKEDYYSWNLVISSCSAL